MTTSFNIGDAVADPKLLDSAKFSRTLTPQERKSKLKIEEWDARLRIAKEITISVFALFAATTLIIICLNIINNSSSTPDDKKWATSLLTLVASGLVGYITGKSSK